MAATRSLLSGDGVIKGPVYGMFDEGVRCRGLWRVFIRAFIRTGRGIGRRGWSVGMGSMCGNDPPWIVREWVTREEGRAAWIGSLMECKKCDEGAE
jgi:hypothetical protein